MGLTNDPVAQALQLYERLRELRASLLKVRTAREEYAAEIAKVESQLRALDLEEGDLRAEYEGTLRALGLS